MRSETRVSRGKTPPGVCVAFIGREGETIEIELRGEEYADMDDEAIVERAKAATREVSQRDQDNLREAGVEQTLDEP
jgi:hypothetical protein